MVKGLDGSGSNKTGEVVNLCLSVSNASCSFELQAKVLSLCNKVVSGDAIVEKFCTNFL